MLAEQSQLYLTHEQVINYLKKIEYFNGDDKQQELPLATYDNLVLLLNLHLKAIPFGALNLAYYKENDKLVENSLDVLNNKSTRGISVRIEDVYNKLVINHREGYCLEHNNLFLHVLQFLGYEAMLILSKGLNFSTYYKTGNVELLGFQHVAIILSLNDKLYLLDPGFSFKTPTMPIELDNYEGIESINSTHHRVIKQNFKEHGHTPSKLEPTNYVLEYANSKDEIKDWKPIYYFNMSPCYPNDLDVLNFYVMYHPTGLYNQHIVLAKNVENGRVTIVDDLLNIYKGGKLETKVQLNSEAERREAYKKYFDIHLDEELKEHIPANFGNFGKF